MAYKYEDREKTETKRGEENLQPLYGKVKPPDHAVEKENNQREENLHDLGSSIRKKIHLKHN